MAAGTPATTALTRLGLAFELHPYDHDPAAASYGLEAAAALSVPPAQVFKTLLVAGDSGLCVGVVPVDRQLDLKAIAAALGLKKVAMAQPAEAERSTGYVVGGISPIGQRKTLRTVVDSSALEFDRVYVSGGRRGLDLSLSPADLLTATRAQVASIAR
ncbi:Cys-tRNA(Pro)/Cys-tRNA(Cys) deacylase [Pedococcus dokdonensis]|uniref:Cys-tRNA(Pro)/Cys-tRNA(Cys) deacylase n=1 Tax=Pedococcus dokdonensis TaxID=443156 RepID=A0A1H0NSW0_9MICO|nr:Cys-tRNA(Pro) deacylase [Pedococcus dokdonensis]SDO95555.1 Cys-tRNA(Pro)/Cys-tRNA(Cys) deacylase [Pedococcus dokdonensis]